MQGIGHKLFGKAANSTKDRLICTYHDKKISRKKVYAKTQTSYYIVEVTDFYRFPLCIDGWDDTRKRCYIEGGYANDAIDWDGTKGK